MDLRDYLRIVRKGWPVILAFVVLGLAAGVGLTLATTKVYQADVQVFVATTNNGDPTSLAQGNTYAQAQVQSYTSIANSPSVVDPVIQRLRLSLSESELAGKITADAPLNKVLVNLHVTDNSPRTAARLANAVAAQFNSVVEKAALTDSTGKPVVRLTVIHPAKIPGAPITPNKVLNIGLGFVVGLLIGVGIVVLRDVLDNTVKSPSDYEEAGVPAMGVVPFDKRTSQEPIAFRMDGTSARSEAYRQIRTNLQFVDVDNPPRIISVTSAMPGEGKSTTAVNLAAALAEAGSRVCLIEADLRRPSLARSLGLVGDVGFTTALIGKTPVEDVLQNAGQNLAVLTSGPIPPNPSELLITEHARAIIRRVASHVDFVVIDTPPLLPVTDGATVATLADATLLVARTGRTTHEQAVRSVAALDKVGRHPVGVVMNAVTRGRGGYSYEYGYYYTEKERPTKRLSRSAVGVGAGKSSPDAADEDSLSLLTADTGTDDPYRPVHAPADDRPTTRSGTPAPEQLAASAPQAREAQQVETPVAAEPAAAVPAEVVGHTNAGHPHADSDEDITTELPTFTGPQGVPHDAGQPAAESPVEQPTDEHPTDEQPTDEQPTDEHPTDEHPVVDRPSADAAAEPHESGTSDPTLELSRPFRPEGSGDVWSAPVPPTFHGTNGSNGSANGSGAQQHDDVPGANGNGSRSSDDEPAYRQS